MDSDYAFGEEGQPDSSAGDRNWPKPSPPAPEERLATLEEKVKQLEGRFTEAQTNLRATRNIRITAIAAVAGVVSVFIIACQMFGQFWSAQNDLQEKYSNKYEELQKQLLTTQNQIRASSIRPSVSPSPGSRANVPPTPK